MEELRYDTGKSFIYAFGAGAGISFLLMIATFAPFFVFTLIVTGFGLAMTIQKYRQILLYDDRIEILNLFGTQLMEIYYSDIKRIGFLHGHDTYGGGYRNNYNYSDVSTEVMVIMLNNNSEAQLDSNDYDDLHEICAYIQQKITPE